MAPTLQRIKETRVSTATKRAPFTNLFAAFAPANDDNTWRGSHLNAPQWGQKSRRYCQSLPCITKRWRGPGAWKSRV